MFRSLWQLLFGGLIKRRREQRVLDYFEEWRQRIDSVPSDPRDQWDMATGYISHRLLEDQQHWRFTHQMRTAMGLPTSTSLSDADPPH
ncbi:MAG: hypothetical protein RL274_1921 [Pseudomonadota bacterium]|jgi:hypothetical protein